jgi:hypothetical protein
VDEDDTNSPTKCKVTTKLVLEMDENKEPLIEVNEKLIRKLKPHQVEGMRINGWSASGVLSVKAYISVYLHC